MARPFKNAASKAAAEAKKAALAKAGKAPAKRTRSKATRAPITKADVIAQVQSKPALQVLTKEAKAKLVGIVRQVRSIANERNALLAKADAVVEANIKFLVEQKIVGDGKDIPDALSTLEGLNLDAIPVWDKESDHPTASAKPEEVKKRIRTKKAAPVVAPAVAPAANASNPSVASPEVASDAPVSVAEVAKLSASKPAAKRVRKPKAKADAAK